MTTLRVEVQRFSIVSSSPFDQVVAKLVAAFGHPDMRALGEGVRNAKSFDEVENLVQSMVGPSGLMEMLRLDIGEVLRKASGNSAPRSWRFIVGNPVIMKQ